MSSNKKNSNYKSDKSQMFLDQSLVTIKQNKNNMYNNGNSIMKFAPNMNSTSTLQLMNIGNSRGKTPTL